MVAELRKIEARKKEREKKTQDLQKLISANPALAEARKQKLAKKKAQVAKMPKLDVTVRILKSSNLRRLLNFDIVYASHKT